MRTLLRRYLTSPLVAMLASLPAASLAAVPVPATPAGETFAAWLDAFNSADLARKEAFARTYGWKTNPDGLERWRAETGGYDLLDIYASNRTTIFVHLKARTHGGEEVGRVTVSASEPAVVTELGTWRIPPGASVDVVRLDAAARKKVVDRVSAALESFYVFPETGKGMSAYLRKRSSQGGYRSALFGIDLARELTRDLQHFGHDKHVEVSFSFFARPAEMASQKAEAEQRRLAAINCGFERAENLRPNIGYVKLNMFGDPAVCAPTATAAMTFVADSDALILDLRDNRGGHTAMPEFIASYLFDQRTHLADTFSRADNSTKESWTLPDVPGKKFVGKPVFVLTSHKTFSAAEALSYSLKNLKRATLVGETTLGGAHPTETRPIDDRFTVRVPFARSISPITRTNWQGTGVEPDVKVAASDALEVALKLATAAAGR